MKKKNLFVGLLLASAGTVEIVVGDTSKCYFYYIDVVME